MSHGNIEGDYKKITRRNDRRAAWLRVTEDKVSWHEGGRDTYDKININCGQFKPADKILSELTGVQKYNLKLTLLAENSKGRFRLFEVFFLSSSPTLQLNKLNIK